MLLTARALLTTRVTALFAATVVAALTAVAPGSSAQAEEPSAVNLDKRITAAAHRLEVVVEEYNDSREDLRTTITESRRLDGQLAPMAADLERRRVQVGGLASETYQRTRSGPTIALFASRTPHQFVGRLLVLNQLANEQRRAVTDLSQAQDRVASTRRTLEALATQQRRQQTKLVLKKATVEGEIAALKGLRQIAYGGGSRFSATDNVDVPAPPYVAGPAAAAVAFAYRQLGKPYRYGSAGPNSYDCSGLTSSAWAQAGVHLPHNARRQFGTVARINRDDLRPGDLIFYYGGISHVAIYIGDGKMIHAPEFGENVRVARYDFQPIHGYGRPG